MRIDNPFHDREEMGKGNPVLKGEEFKVCNPPLKERIKIILDPPLKGEEIRKCNSFHKWRK
jgi:hypothetical protein